MYVQNSSALRPTELTGKQSLMNSFSSSTAFFIRSVSSCLNSLVQISNYNHPKIGEMVGIGSALTSFKATNTGTTQNQSLGLDKHDDITINKIEDPVSRTYT